MKKQLIKQSISGKSLIDQTEKYLHKKGNWLIECHYQTGSDVMEVVELAPKEKIDLMAVLEIIKSQLKALVPDDTEDCGYRIYRLKKDKICSH